VPQNTTCRVPLNTKIRPAGRIKCNREKRLDAVPVTLHLSKDFCINPLIKIIVQSKALFESVLYTVPNTAFERQTLPHLNQRINQSLYLPYNFSAGSKKCISTKKKIRFANRQFGIKA
jgi:hypothetical protein